MNQVVDRFIRQNRVQQGDTLIVDRTLFESTDPFAVYLGRQCFAFRKHQRIEILTPGQIFYWHQYYPPKKVNRFLGTPNERQDLVHWIRQSRNIKAYYRLIGQTEVYQPQPQKRSKGSPDNSALWGAVGLGALLLLGAAFFASQDDDED